MVLLAILVISGSAQKCYNWLCVALLLLKKKCFLFFDDTICDDGLAVANGDTIKLQASVFIIE